jgi:hypothetical protein
MRRADRSLANRVLIRLDAEPGDKPARGAVLVAHEASTKDAHRRKQTSDENETSV